MATNPTKRGSAGAYPPGGCSQGWIRNAMGNARQCDVGGSRGPIFAFPAPDCLTVWLGGTYMVWTEGGSLVGVAGFDDFSAMAGGTGPWRLARVMSCRTFA